VGGLVAGSPAEAADQADYLLTMLADGAAVELAMFGPGGAAGTVGEGAVWLQMSTVGVRSAELLGRGAALRDLVFPSWPSACPASRPAWP
jgi:3-hydroxyisobutyrate dehydrogenase